MYMVTCKYCGQQFEAKKKDMNVCKSCKNRPCEVCGKPFVRDWPYDQHCCSKECRKIWKSDPERNKEWNEKREATVRERYGVNNVSSLDSVKQKISENHRTDEFKEKVRQTSLAKYGVEHYQSSEVVKEHARQNYIDKYGVGHAPRLERIRRKISERLKDTEVRAQYQASMQVSKLIREFAELLNNSGLQTVFEHRAGDEPFDICIKDTNILLEINSSYTHSALSNHGEKDSDYHLKKTLLAKEHGYRCIHIFDWDNKEKIAAMLNTKKALYARNCQLQSISPAVANEFLDQYHIQGSARGAKYCYGIFSEGELVSVMTFGKPRYNRNYEWELLRLCTDSKFRVIGGPSRMMKHFIEDADPKSIISYCDVAKFTGEVYEKLGFTLHHISPPAMIWSLDDEYITDNLLRQRGYDQLFGTNYGKGTSNEDLMIENGWLPVYDCGQMVFEWKKS